MCILGCFWGRWFCVFCWFCRVVVEWCRGDCVWWFCVFGGRRMWELVCGCGCCWCWCYIWWWVCGSVVLRCWSFCVWCLFWVLRLLFLFFWKIVFCWSVFFWCLGFCCVVVGLFGICGCGFVWLNCWWNYFWLERVWWVLDCVLSSWWVCWVDLMIWVYFCDVLVCVFCGWFCGFGWFWCFCWWCDGWFLGFFWRSCWDVCWVLFWFSFLFLMRWVCFLFDLRIWGFGFWLRWLWWDFYECCCLKGFFLGFLLVLMMLCRCLLCVLELSGSLRGGYCCYGFWLCWWSSRFVFGNCCFIVEWFWWFCRSCCLFCVCVLGRLVVCVVVFCCGWGVW